MNRITINNLFITVLLAFACASDTEQNLSIKPGKVWSDTGGDPINAHGAGILYFNGVYYWYGEIKSDSTWRVDYLTSWECYRTHAGGINCYSSTDLKNWKYEGVVLAPEKEDSAHDLHFSKVIERPKVIYNDSTRKFVMWLHVDSEDYSYARAGVAVSDSPTDPFEYIESVRPYGQMSRDITLFKDSDGKAYHIFSSENNATMYISLLDDSYLKHTNTFRRIFIGESREAPMILKHQKKYYMVTSGCSGWSPNEAQYAIADSILGAWQGYGNPCVGEGSETTFSAQGAFLLPQGDDNENFIFIADRWNKTDLKNSRYVWLPGKIENGTMHIEWQDEWTPAISAQ